MHLESWGLGAIVRVHLLPCGWLLPSWMYSLGRSRAMLAPPLAQQTLSTHEGPSTALVRGIPPGELSILPSSRLGLRTFWSHLINSQCDIWPLARKRHQGDLELPPAVSATEARDFMSGFFLSIGISCLLAEVYCWEMVKRKGVWGPSSCACLSWQLLVCMRWDTSVCPHSESPGILSVHPGLWHPHSLSFKRYAHLVLLALYPRWQAAL